MSLTVNVSEIVAKSSNPLLRIHKSWKRIPFVYIAEILNGYAFESSKFNKLKGFPLLRIRDIVKNKTACFYDGPYDPMYVVEPGDMVIGMDGDFNCDRWRGSKALLNQRVCKVTVVSDCYKSKFFDLVLPAYLQVINEKTSSVTVKHLSSKSISEIPLPLPPIPEQQRIVAKIEELFTKLDAGIEALKRIKSQLKRYRQAVLKYAFEGKLTEEWRQANKDKLEPASVLLERIKAERKMKLGKIHKELPTLNPSDLQELPNDWVWARLGETSFVVTKGATPTSYGFSYEPKGINFIKVENILNGKINRNSIKEFITVEVHNFLKRSQLEENDVLFSIAGTIGRIGIVQRDDLPANINQAIAIIRCPWQFIEPNYLRTVLESYIVKNSFRNSSRGVGMYNIGLEDVKNIVYPFPPFLEQLKIVEEIERRFSVADEIEKVVDQSLKQSERLRQSILKRAFEGKLVPQWPDLPAPQPGKYWVYVIKCSNDSNYIGQTDNLRKRWEEHLSGTGADWAKRYPPQYVMYWKEFSSREEAVAKEKWLKTGFGRKWIKREEKAGRLWHAGEPAEKLLERIKAEKAKRLDDINKSRKTRLPRPLKRARNDKPNLGCV